MKTNAFRQARVIELLTIIPMTSIQIAEETDNSVSRVSTILAMMAESRIVKKIGLIAQPGTRGIYLWALYSHKAEGLPSERARKPKAPPLEHSEFARAGPVYCRQFKWRIGRTV